MKRVAPSIRLKEEMERLLPGTGPTPDPPMGGFVGLVARYMLQVAIEAETPTAFLGPDHYRRGDRERAGRRNGCEAKRVQRPRSRAARRRGFIRGCRSGEGRAPMISRRLCAGCMCAFLKDLKARDRKDPVLVVMDEAPGRVKAAKRVWPHASRCYDTLRSLRLNAAMSPKS